MKKTDRDLEGWKPVSRANPMPTKGWVFLKHPGKMPKVYLANHIPIDLDMSSMYWKAANVPTDF